MLAHSAAALVICGPHARCVRLLYHPYTVHLYLYGWSWMENRLCHSLAILANLPRLFVACCSTAGSCADWSSVMASQIGCGSAALHLASAMMRANGSIS
jgi:hypothetical protein